MARSPLVVGARDVGADVGRPTAGVVISALDAHNHANLIAPHKRRPANQTRQKSRLKVCVCLADGEGDRSWNSSDGVFMADQSAAELAELTFNVLSALPCGVVCAVGDDGDEDPQRVVVERREGDGFVARWPADPPRLGSMVHLSVEGAGVYQISAKVISAGFDSCALLSVTELRRARQRRSAPRAVTSELIVVSYDGGIDGQLTDVSATGAGFVLDRALPIDAQIRMLVNFERRVIPTTAQVCSVKRLQAATYRIGATFVDIAAYDRVLFARYAAKHTSDRRTHPADPNSLRFRLGGVPDSQPGASHD
jgi:hypothetical protein